MTEAGVNSSIVVMLEGVADRTVRIARWLVLLVVFVLANWVLWIFLDEWLR